MIGASMSQNIPINRHHFSEDKLREALWGLVNRLFYTAPESRVHRLLREDPEDVFIQYHIEAIVKELKTDGTVLDVSALRAEFLERPSEVDSEGD